MDLEGVPLLWLGRADDRESIEDVLTRLDRTPIEAIQQDLIGVIGAHGDSSLVVPELTRILASSVDEDLRAEAARALGLHAVPDALEALDGIARGDRSVRLRCEAAEAIGAQRFAPALDALIRLARELPDRTVRLQAVEAFGDRTEPAAVPALLGIVEGDPDPAFQREAVETLGELPDGRGLEALAELARSHPGAHIRKEALETYRDSASPEQVARLRSRLGDLEGDSR
jgi:HEAT repeat protein